MNCRDVQSLLFPDRDDVLDASQRERVAGHVAVCPECRRIQQDLTAGLASWRHEAAAVAVPDAEREWHAVRRRIRGAEASGTTRRRAGFLSWLAVPLTAAAAMAVALFISPDGTGSSAASAPVRATRADSVEIPGNEASTMIYVDEKSGWLFVLVSDPLPKQG